MSFYLIRKSDADANILRSLKDNTYYKVRGKIQRASLDGPNPRCNFLVEQIEAVPDAPLKPSDLAGRIANLEGLAIAKGVVEIHGEKAFLDGQSDWPKNIEGKRVSVRGKIEPKETGWQFVQPVWKLVDLADQVGQEVSLDGKLWSLNGHWWFDYRDSRIYLLSEAGPQLAFANDDHGRNATITGKLLHQL